MRDGRGQFFFFFSTKISCTCCGSLSWGLVWGFGVGCGGLIGGGVVGVGLSDASTQGMDRMVCSRGGCVWLAPRHGFPSGQSAVFGVWPWIGLSGPGEGLGASLIISLMLCNYIQNCR